MLGVATFDHVPWSASYPETQSSLHGGLQYELHRSVCPDSDGETHFRGLVEEL